MFGPVINRAKITHREYDAIVDRLRAGKEVEDVAAEFNRGWNTVNVIRGRVGIERRGRG